MSDPYRHAHWGILAALGVIVAGFWPSFFRSLDGGDTAHTVHGVTATLWVLCVALQSWLISRGLVRWHRMVAVFALIVLLVMSGAALLMVAIMQRNTSMPPFLPPLLAFIDIPSIAFLLLLVGLALRHVRRPAIHKRYMAATILLALPPALGRLYPWIFGPRVDFMTGLHAAFFTVDLILIALILLDRRMPRRYAPYPLSLAFFVMVQVLMGPMGRNETWRDFLGWYAALPFLRG